MAAPASALRPGRDADGPGCIRLIGAAWAEYPGCVLDVDAEAPELRRLASHFAAAGGALWVAEDGAGGLAGMVAARPLGSDRAHEICRLYVDRAARGTGLAHRLLDAAEAHAAAAGAERLVLWTDTRFAAAHAFYEKRGYVRAGSIRLLDDLSRSLEFRYAKPARGLVVEALDAAAAGSAERRLGAVLAACVEDGASVGILPPLPAPAARQHWRGVSRQVAAGERVLLVAWAEGALAGAVQLDLATPQDQPHRAGLAMLLVDPAHRRRGVGRALVARAEQAAHGLGRRLMTLGVRAGDPAEALFLAAGWREGGRVPGYVLDARGRPGTRAVLWKVPGRDG